MSELPKILLVDDRRENLLVLEALLRRSDASLLKAESGKQALELLLEHQVALALIDVQMPDLDGFAVAELMRGVERTREIPIIFVTAGLHDQTRIFKGYDSGAVDFLVKPLEPHILNSKVSVFLQLFRQRQQLGERIAQLEAAQGELRQERDRQAWLARLAEENPDAVMRLGRDGRLLYLNPSSRAAFAEERLELGAPAPAALLEASRRAFETGRLAELELKSGQRWFWIRVSPAGAEATCYARDITDRKRVEEALLEADRRKDEFLAVLSHELRNPLAPIQSSLYILERTPPDGAQARTAKEIIGRQVTQLSSLVNDLLDVTRITRNKIHLQRERLELNQLVRRTVDDNRPLFERNQVQLSCLLAPAPLVVDADATRVAQVVGNLLQNAAKFTRRGGNTRISVEAEGGEALIRVTDDGVGMSPETLARLFQPFMQADQSLDRSKGGLGLGLSLVKRLVELHGGTIAAHSDGLGKGAELTVRLPLDPGAVPEAAGPGSRGARRRILIIEDNLDAAESLRDALALGGHQVEIASSGPVGLERARSFRPQVVLCDIGLPGMDGFEVARTFRQDPALRSIWLVALTGYALPEDRARAEQAGFQHHLAKPVSPESLEELLESLPDQPLT